MELQEAIRGRYSVRSYQDTPIPDDVLNAILEAGRLAPTAVNAQPQRIYVLRSPEALEKIRGLTRCAFNAPVVLLIAYDADTEWHNPLEAGITSGQQDAAIVATHMMLTAYENGVGSCWVCYFPNTAVKAAFALPENEIPALLMPLGYPAADAAPSERHAKRQQPEALVRTL